MFINLNNFYIHLYFSFNTAVVGETACTNTGKHHRTSSADGLTTSGPRERELWYLPPHGSKSSNRWQQSQARM
jgi:hypothetical protein